MSTVQQKPVVDSRSFREVMGLFATGVTVVATKVEGEYQGMTANALTSVSLEPLLILVCVQKEAHMARFLQQTGQFSVNILNEEQADLSNFFAGLWPHPEPPPFTFEPWVCGPKLGGALGGLACQVQEFLEGGDHWIITGRVVDLYRQDQALDPLLYYTGQYRYLHDGLEK